MCAVVECVRLRSVDDAAYNISFVSAVLYQARERSSRTASATNSRSIDGHSARLGRRIRLLAVQERRSTHHICGSVVIRPDEGVAQGCSVAEHAAYPA